MEEDDGSNYGGQRKSTFSDTGKRQEYLLLLQERNRLKKMITSKTVVERENEEKEKGFSTLFCGANAQKVADNPHRRVKRGAPKVPSTLHTLTQGNPALLQEAAPGSAPVPARKGWAVGRPKFLFGVRLGDQPQSPIGLNNCNADVNSVKHSKMTLLDEEDNDDDENYDDYLEDFEEYGGEEEFEESDREELIDGSSILNESDSADGKKHATQDQNQYNTVQNDSSFIGIQTSVSHHQSKPPSPVESSSAVPIFYSNRITSRASAAGGFNDKNCDKFALPKNSRESVLKPDSSVPILKAIYSKNDFEKLSMIPKSSYRGLTEAFGVIDSSSPASEVLRDQQNDVRSAIASSSSSSSLKETRMTDSIGNDSALNNGAVLSSISHVAAANLLPQPLKGDICIRIRIHNTWTKSKFVSLEAVRLTFIDPSNHYSSNNGLNNQSDNKNINNTMNSNNDKNKYWIDLRTFAVKIMSGIEQLSSSSEAVRSIQNLLGNTQNNLNFSSNTTQGSNLGLQNSTTKNTWKGPMSSGYPLDIYLEGNLPHQLVGMFSEKDAMMSSLQLHIWNQSPSSSSGNKAENSDIASLLSSAAKDMDVYLGSSCVWSGTISVENEVSNSSNQKNIPPSSSLSNSRNNNNTTIQIGKYIENNLLAVLGPNRGASEIIPLGKKTQINALKVGNKIVNDIIGNDKDVVAASNNVFSVSNVHSDKKNNLYNDSNNNSNSNNNENRSDQNDSEETPPAWLLGLKPKSVSTSYIPLRGENQETMDPSQQFIPQMNRSSAAIGMGGNKAILNSQSVSYSVLSDPRVVSNIGNQSNYVDNGLPQQNKPLFSVINDLKFVKDKNRISSANGGRRKKILKDEENILQEDCEISKIIVAENVLDEESEEEEIGTFPSLSSFNSDHLSLSASARRLRRKEASSPDSVILGIRLYSSNYIICSVILFYSKLLSY